ncbi:kinase-like domain-containing protein [Flammula alnicola]|nr:kinase-like domain-containing protein [Flammula alnicola]
MSEGDLCRYLDERKTELNFGRRLQILSEVAEGLAYLHSARIIHGDLTTANILMHEGRAHLHDFGLSNTKAETRNSSFMISKVGGAVRWAAPELFPFDEDTPELAMHCDIYSFGAVALHVISGRILYEDLSDFQILMQLTRPESRASGPPRPPEPLLTDECWGFICCCLTRDYLARPDVNELRKLLKMLRSGSSTEALAANVSFDRDESSHSPVDEFNHTEMPR